MASAATNPCQPCPILSLQGDTGGYTQLSMYHSSATFCIFLGAARQQETRRCRISPSQFFFCPQPRLTMQRGTFQGLKKMFYFWACSASCCHCPFPSEPWLQIFMYKWSDRTFKTSRVQSHTTWCRLPPCQHTWGPLQSCCRSWIGALLATLHFLHILRLWLGSARLLGHSQSGWQWSGHLGRCSWGGALSLWSHIEEASRAGSFGHHLRRRNLP